MNRYKQIVVKNYLCKNIPFFNVCIRESEFLKGCIEIDTSGDEKNRRFLTITRRSPKYLHSD